MKRPGLEALESREVLSATIYTVDSTGSSTAGSGTSGTLPYVISLANADPNPDGTEVTFNLAVFSTPQTIDLTNDLLLEGSGGPLAVDGPGAGLLTIDGQGRGTTVITRNTASISGLTITGGVATESRYSHELPEGGGVLNADTLTLPDCTISGNSGYRGGGIINYGVATIVGCTISDNTAAFGAGVFDGITVGGDTTLTDCTISGNSASGDGGGLVTAGATTLTDCTISGNSSASNGGGIHTYPTALVTITSCTISGNTATMAGGGLYNLGTTTLTDTIIANNDLGAGGASDIASGHGNRVTGTYNLIGPGGSDGIAGGTGGNIVLTSLEGLNLGPLASNGGPTKTMALLPGSPAINAGTAASGVTTDQRGQPLDTPPDIGAYQLRPGPLSYGLGPILVVGQRPVFVRNLNEKRKPVGKPVLTGFTLEFSAHLSAGAANDPANYQVGTFTSKRVKKKVEHILHPLSGFRVSYDAADDAVTITLGKPQKFPNGGQITLLGGLDYQADGVPIVPSVFAISRGGKSIVSS